MGLLDLFKKKEYDEVGNPIINDDFQIKDQVNTSSNQVETPNIQMLKLKALKFGIVSYKYKQ